MRRLKFILPVVFLLGLAFWIFRTPDDAAVIEKMLARAAILASFDVNESPFERLAAAEKLSELFSDEANFLLVTTEGEEEFVFTKQEIKERILAVRSSLAQLAVSVTNVEVVVTEDSAEVSAMGSAMGREPEREDYFLEKHPVQIDLQRIEGSWKIVSARNTDLIEK